MASQIAALALRLPRNLEPAILIRSTTGSYGLNGFIPGEPRRTDIQLVVKASPGSEREIEAEGYRETNRRTFFLSQSVIVGREGSNRPDLIVHRGQRFRMIEVHDWGGYVEATGIEETE